MEEVKKLSKMQNTQTVSGGDFFHNINMRVNSRFAKALIVSTFEGHTTFKESLQLLEIKKISTLKKTAKNLGVDF